MSAKRLVEVDDGQVKPDIPVVFKPALVVTWPQLGVTVVAVAVIMLSAIWWLVGERTRYVLSEDFWASERIRPAMALYIAQNTVSQKDFDKFTTKFDSVTSIMMAHINEVDHKVDLHMTQTNPRR